MTDGIIQKVIKRYIAHMNSFNGYTNFNSTEIPSLYKQLEQELIEEIRKAYPIDNIHESDNEWFNDNIRLDNILDNINIREKLIGDTQD